ncbi:PIN domain-containing protein [Ammonifex thiophilus]|uniref:PIN domain-containing protein n=1 Tax=Ammonifex thiophilus TaxID=444093 RepID=A0A3D8P8R4_9THEO|nr:PIN domain-containing protein [Ammonifex thiophilus]RDV84819.1 PIN domain-containing protein [Ammonifex thiophilus]
MNAKKIERQFLDTNILVYAHDVSAGEKHIRAKNLLENLWLTGSGCLSVQVLQEFYITVTRKVKTPLSPEKALQVIEYLSNWRVHVPGPVDVLEAIRIHQHLKISFWDAMIIRSAEVLGCRIVWSEDLNPGQYYGQVVVKNPFA